MVYFVISTVREDIVVLFNEGVDVYVGDRVVYFMIFGVSEGWIFLITVLVSFYCSFAKLGLLLL